MMTEIDKFRKEVKKGTIVYICEKCGCIVRPEILAYHKCNARKGDD